jgi:hypothetical protein
VSDYQARDTVAAARERRTARLAANTKPRKPMRPRKRVSASRAAKLDPDYLRAIHGLPCLVCAAPSEVHHEPAKGMAGGAPWHDRSTVPLCPSHHRTGRDSRHELGLAKFEAMHRLNLAGEIALLQAEHG